MIFPTRWKARRRLVIAAGVAEGAADLVERARGRRPGQAGVGDAFVGLHRLVELAEAQERVRGRVERVAADVELVRRLGGLVVGHVGVETDRLLEARLGVQAVGGPQQQRTRKPAVALLLAWASSASFGPEAWPAWRARWTSSDRARHRSATGPSKRGVSSPIAGYPTMGRPSVVNPAGRWAQVRASSPFSLRGATGASAAAAAAAVVSRLRKAPSSWIVLISGAGNTTVEFLSTAISARVWRLRS